MKNKEFTLNSREEVAEFDNLLMQYAKERGFDLNYLPLTKIYDAIQGRSEKGKLFAAFLDIKINFLLLSCDMCSIGGAWNEKFSKGKLEDGCVLEGQEKFFGKMDIHRFSTSFIFRYRALWDKVMGLLVLMIIPLKYDDFCGSKSRRKKFKKIMNELSAPEDFINTINQIISNFDDLFRTAEAHGTGVLRKYTFTMELIHENPQKELFRHWNIINNVISLLGDAPGIELNHPATIKET